MSTFVGIVLTLAIFVLVLRFLRFVARLGRRSVNDLPNYADGPGPVHVRPQAQHRSVRQAKPVFTQDELDYYAAHVPASAGKQRPVPGAGRPDLRNAIGVDQHMQ